MVTDLRYLTAEQHAAWMGAVIGGMHKDRGMASYAGSLTAEDARNIHAFVIERAHEMLETLPQP